MDIDFPYSVDARGRTATTGHADHVRDMVEQLLFTAPGERVNRPDFGCGLLDQVFEPNSFELAAVLQAAAEAQLQHWLGDVLTLHLLSVTSDEATLRVEVQYVLRATGESRTQVVAAGVAR